MYIHASDKHLALQNLLMQVAFQQILTILL